MMANGIQGFTQIEQGSSEQIILDLIQYIEDTLPEFPYSPEFDNILAKKKNENQHSESFCVYMGNSSYNFQREISQKGSYTIDIGVYHGSNLIFTIEAKILPTPEGTKSKPRAEHEYVYGKGAGIQRFRDGFHGVDNQDNPLSENGMIAYIKAEDFEHWFSRINQWILDAQWGQPEQLQKGYFRQIAKLCSLHPRQQAPNMKLHHFWIDVS